MQSESVAKLAEALAKARPKIEGIPKNKTAKVKGQTKAGSAYEYEYHYADLDGVLKAITKALNDEGLSVIQPLMWRENVMLVRTVLLHSSGEWIASEFPVPANAEIQKVGAAITYIRRYALSGIVGVASEDDNDAQHVSDKGKKAKKPEPPASRPAGPYISEDQAREFFKAAKSRGLDVDDIRALMLRVTAVERSQDIPAAKYDDLLASLDGVPE